MSTEQSEVGKSYMWFVAVGLALYCVLLTALTGDIGFNGDDWWIFAYPYWNSFLDSLVLYAHKFLRPVEGLYWISLFELFGFNKLAFHLCSLWLLAGAAVLMGVSLDRAFPGRRDCVSIAVLLAFFLPPVSCLTYVLFTDNSRLSMLLFWLSVIAFQRWAQGSSRWSGLALPMGLYMCSFLTYETSSFLIFLVPLLVWPVHRRSGRHSDRAFLIRLSVGVVVAFAAAVAIRLVILKGGAVGQSYLLPPLNLVWSYLALLTFYLLAPFTSMSADRWALLLGFLVVMGTAAIIFLFTSRDRPAEEVEAESRFEPGSRRYLVGLGVGILMLGMLPYQLAGYGSFTPRLVETLRVKCAMLPVGDLSWFNFTWASRIYSSASFGVAILLACGMSAWRQSSAKLTGKVVALVAVGFMAVFHAGLSQDWREAAEIRNDLMQSLVSQVPDVKSGTNFVFLDIACSHKRAAVIRKENGLRELVEMLYEDPTLGAWRLYPYAYDQLTHVHQQAVATPSGFLCGDSQRQSETAPYESLLLFKRSGRELVLLDRITAQDCLVPTGIAWRGVKQLTSNLERIETWQTISPQARFAALTSLTSGLISTLQLTLLKWPHAVFPVPKYNIVRNELRRNLSKTRSYQFAPRL